MSQTGPGTAIWEPLFVASRGDGRDSGLQRWTPHEHGWKLSGNAGARQLASLIRHPSLPIIYGVSATDATSSRLHSWRLGGDGLRPIDDAEGFGADPCHLNIDPTGRLLVAANYASGDLTVQKLSAHGRFDAPACVLAFTGSSIDAERQTQSHPHQAVFVGGQLVVVDLGADVLRIFEVDPEIDAAGALRQVRQETVPPGS